MNFLLCEFKSKICQLDSFSKQPKKGAIPYVHVWILGKHGEKGRRESQW